MEAARLWAQLRPVLRGLLGADAMHSWIEPLVVLGASETHVRLGAANLIASSRIRVEFLPRLQRVWESRDRARRRLVVEIQPPKPRQPRRSTATDPGASLRIITPDLTAGAQPALRPLDQAQANLQPAPQCLPGEAEAPRLSLCEPTGQRTFASLAVGAENRVAVAIGRRVAEASPTGELVGFYGAHGTGKTHLVEAIMMRAREAQPDLTVRLVSAHNFTDAFTGSLRSQTITAFKEAMRGASILLIDDIHFILGKTATQVELFQTIQSVTAAGGTVVVTAEAAPEALQHLSSRERSILAGGFVAQLREPDFELRRQIARLKVAAYTERHPSFQPPEEALDLIAARVAGTGRDVEGAVRQVLAETAMVGVEATMDRVQRILSEETVIALPVRSLTVDQIKKRVAASYSISLEDLVGQCRRRNFARPRQLAMYLARKMANRSFPDIAARFGGRDHTTVIHAVRKVEELMLQDPVFAREVQDVIRKITAPEPGKPG